MTMFEGRYRKFEDLSVASFERECPATLGNGVGGVERHRLIVGARVPLPRTTIHAPQPGQVTQEHAMRCSIQEL